MREHLGLDRDEQFVIHALRHTFASRLVQRGVELATVSKLLGHRSLLTTMRYAHLAPHNLQAAVEVLDPGSEVYKICNSLHAQSRAQESRAVPG
jgi:site-specific recombinase XerD